MKDRITKFSIRIPATLSNYRLEFNKKRCGHNETFANILPDSSSNVYGVLYEIPEKSILKLDIKEGVSNKHYYRTTVSVTSQFGIIQAECYIACDRRIVQNIPPSNIYVNHLLKGLDLHGILLKREILRAQNILN